MEIIIRQHNDTSSRICLSHLSPVAEIMISGSEAETVEIHHVGGRVRPSQETRPYRSSLRPERFRPAKGNLLPSLSAQPGDEVIRGRPIRGGTDLALDQSGTRRNLALLPWHREVNSIASLGKVNSGILGQLENHSSLLLLIDICIFCDLT